MKTTIAMVLALGALAGEARADEPVAAPSAPTAPAPPVAAPSTPPSSGLLAILAGAGLLAGGVGNLASAPICAVGPIQSSARTPCLGLSLGFGFGLLAGGVPLVVLGARQRGAWQEWSRTQRVGFSPMPGGGAASWSVAF